MGGGWAEQESQTAAAELRQEREEAHERTVKELSDPRWPQGTSLTPGLHGARAPAKPAPVPEAELIFVAARARDFDALRFPSALLEAHVCLALYPLSLGRDPPCYELQIASVRLAQRQLHAQYTDRPVLLVAVGADADAIFESLPGLWHSAPDDAVALRAEGGLDETLPGPGHAWALSSHCASASLRGDLSCDRDVERLATRDPAWGTSWRAVRARVGPLLEKTRRGAKRQSVAGQQASRPRTTPRMPRPM